jgi:hypothetical protein
MLFDNRGGLEGGCLLGLSRILGKKTKGKKNRTLMTLILGIYTDKKDKRQKTKVKKIKKWYCFCNPNPL